MNLRAYYQKIRDVEARIAEEFPIVVSQETPDGGKEGTHTEVPRKTAAKLIVEGIARLAKEEEARAFQAAIAEGVRLAEQAVAAARVQLTVLPTAELDKLKNATRSKV